MSQENLNSHPLNELEFIPGEVPFKKEAAWNKLQERIGEKKQKTNYWYLVAASILVVLSAGIFMINRKELNNSVLVGNRSSNNENGTQQPSSSESGNLQKDSASFIQKNSSVKNKVKSIKINKQKPGNKISIVNRTMSKQSVNIKIDSQIPTGSKLNPSNLITISSVPDVLNNISTEVSQRFTASQLQPVKKKLKVLHHNHLEGTLPVAYPDLSARSGEMQGTTGFSRNKSDDFIRIKITTPN